MSACALTRRRTGLATCPSQSLYRKCYARALLLRRAVVRRAAGRDVERRAVVRRAAGRVFALADLRAVVALRAAGLRPTVRLAAVALLADAVALRAAGLRAVVLRAAVVLLAAEAALRATGLRAVVLRAVDFAADEAAVDLRAVTLRVVVLRAAGLAALADLRAVVERLDAAGRRVLFLIGISFLLVCRGGITAHSLCCDAMSSSVARWWVAPTAAVGPFN